MKYVNLLGSAYVNGVLRHPHEGSLHLSNEEAKRLLDGDMAVDVTDDFSAADVNDEPAQKITTANGKPKG